MCGVYIGTNELCLLFQWSRFQHSTNKWWCEFRFLMHIVHLSVFFSLMLPNRFSRIFFILFTFGILFADTVTPYSTWRVRAFDQQSKHHQGGQGLEKGQLNSEFFTCGKCKISTIKRDYNLNLNSSLNESAFVIPRPRQARYHKCFLHIICECRQGLLAHNHHTTDHWIWHLFLIHQSSTTSCAHRVAGGWHIT